MSNRKRPALLTPEMRAFVASARALGHGHFTERQLVRLGDMLRYGLLADNATDEMLVETMVGHEVWGGYDAVALLLSSTRMHLMPGGER